MDANALGTFLANKRRDKNMTQEQVADKLNVTAKAVSRWERGIGLPDINMIEPLALVLDTGILELMTAKKHMVGSTNLHEWYMTIPYFRPHVIDLSPEGLEKCPDFMKEHVKNNGRIWLLEEPEDGQAHIGTEIENGRDTFISSDYVLWKIKVSPETIEEHPEPLRSYLLNGGKFYLVGEPKDGKVTISIGKEPDAYTFVENEHKIAEELENDPASICKVLIKYMRDIKDSSLSDDVRLDACGMMYNYLVHCTYIEELRDLVPIYCDEVNYSLVTGYEPLAIWKFIVALSKRYEVKG